MNAPDTCPTCGSKNRRVREQIVRNNEPWGCTDAWHDAAALSSSSGATPTIEVVSEATPVAGDRSRQIWVDDSKPEPSGCAVARTYDDALRMIRRFDYDVLYLDHDLGEARTGYDLLKQLAAERRVPTRVECISWNPVGRKRIEALVAELGVGGPASGAGSETPDAPSAGGETLDAFEHEFVANPHASGARYLHATNCSACAKLAASRSSTSPLSASRADAHAQLLDAKLLSEVRRIMGLRHADVLLEYEARVLGHQVGPQNQTSIQSMRALLIHHEIECDELLRQRGSAGAAPQPPTSAPVTDAANCVCRCGTENFATKSRSHCVGCGALVWQAGTFANATPIPLRAPSADAARAEANSYGVTCVACGSPETNCQCNESGEP